jgi:16S rRNA (adenine1518-N6/adenine1519-N6)-dimethyltransferase
MQGNTTKNTARKHGAPLGQHFLTRPEIAGWVADASGLGPTDTVLEIGPGHGILTRELLARAGKVIAIEKDPKLVKELTSIFSKNIGNETLSIISADIRDFDPSSHYALATTNFALCANIPYYLTGYIIRKFLTATHQPTTLSLLIQKEVAERIVAKDGKESLLSLSVKAYGTPRIAHIVKAGAFSPPPKVDSAVLAIEHIARAAFASPAHEARFFETLHLAFQSKRKSIGGTLREAVSDAQFAQCGIPKTARPEDVRLCDWLALSG